VEDISAGESAHYDREEKCRGGDTGGGGAYRTRSPGYSLGGNENKTSSRGLRIKAGVRGGNRLCHG